MDCEEPVGCSCHFDDNRFAWKPWWLVVEPVDQMLFVNFRRWEAVPEVLVAEECERSAQHCRWMVDGILRIQPALEAEL